MFRLLPSRERRMVGPFIFWDQMGPTQFSSGQGMDVLPHPHIGLATITYLFDGEVFHRDSLGSRQSIRPGDVNWMTAGRGIVHSERTPDAQRGRSLFGLQSWVALPASHEEAEPSFVHVPAEELPEIEEEGIHIRLIAGSLLGSTSAIPIASEMVYADIALQSGAVFEVPSEVEDRAVHVAVGEVAVGGREYEQGDMFILQSGRTVPVEAKNDARVMLLGGVPMEEPRHIWWNFVSSRRDRIEQAKADWKAGRFPSVEGETESVPLPEI